MNSSRILPDRFARTFFKAVVVWWWSRWHFRGLLSQKFYSVPPKTLSWWGSSCFAPDCLPWDLTRGGVALPWPLMPLEVVVVPAAQQSFWYMCWMQRGHVVPGASHPLQSSFCLAETLRVSAAPGAQGLSSEEASTTCPFPEAVVQRVEHGPSVFSSESSYRFWAQSCPYWACSEYTSWIFLPRATCLHRYLSGGPYADLGRADAITLPC